jgi:phage tail tape-measure protein
MPPIDTIKRKHLESAMSQQDNFASGFFLGAIVGGVVGGALGALLVQRLNDDSTEEPLLKSESSSQTKPTKARRRSLRASSEQNIELARQSLEDKIAQLNTAIDDVRQQLGNVNGRAIDPERENPISTRRNFEGTAEDT